MSACPWCFIKPYIKITLPPVCVLLDSYPHPQFIVSSFLLFVKGWPCCCCLCRHLPSETENYSPCLELHFPFPPHLSLAISLLTVCKVWFLFFLFLIKIFPAEHLTCLRGNLCRVGARTCHFLVPLLGEGWCGCVCGRGPWEPQQAPCPGRRHSLLGSFTAQEIHAAWRGTSFMCWSGFQQLGKVLFAKQLSCKGEPPGADQGLLTVPAACHLVHMTGDGWQSGRGLSWDAPP